MRNRAEQVVGGSIGRVDCFDHVRSALTGRNGRGLVKDLDILRGRLDRVRSLSGRFSTIEMSPYVQRMVETADLQRLAV